MLSMQRFIHCRHDNGWIWVPRTFCRTAEAISVSSLPSNSVGIASRELMTFRPFSVSVGEFPIMFMFASSRVHLQ